MTCVFSVLLYMDVKLGQSIDSKNVVVIIFTSVVFAPFSCCPEVSCSRYFGPGSNRLT